MVYYTFDKLYYLRGTAVVSDLRVEGHRVGGSGSPIVLSVSPSVAAQMKKGVITSGKVKGTHRFIQSGGKIRKAVVEIKFESLV